MNIWLVNPFDPLPSDPEQPGRYATLATMLAQRGHSITWWTSDFSHRFKKPLLQSQIREGCRVKGIEAVFLHSPPYKKNVSLARLRNHRVLAHQFAKAAAMRADRPDVVLASAPPPELARQAAMAGHRAGARVIIDVQDLWPETFVRLAPQFARPAFKLLLRPWAKASREAYANADAIVAVADEYAKKAVELSGSRQYTETIPLGIDLSMFDAAAATGQHYRKRHGENWLVYSGSLNRSYDCLTILKAFASLPDEIRQPTKLFLTGQGELLQKAQALARNQRLNAELTGFLSFEEWAALIKQCDIGFNASFPEAMIYLPNKIFYYFAAGVAVLNTLPGQCSRIVQEGQVGLDYTAGDVSDCRRAMIELLQDPARLAAMKTASRKLAREQYDRKILYARFVSLIERVGTM